LLLVLLVLTKNSDVVVALKMRGADNDGKFYDRFSQIEVYFGET
jgi:hypothetical protein